LLAKLTFEIERPKRKPKEYPENPKTLGERVRKHRMGLGLYQKDTARFFGAKTDTIACGRGIEKVFTQEGCVSFGVLCGFRPKRNST